MQKITMIGKRKICDIGFVCICNIIFNLLYRINVIQHILKKSTISIL